MNAHLTVEFMLPSEPIAVKRTSSGHQADIKRTSSGHQADIKRTSSGHQADIKWTSSGYQADIKQASGGCDKDQGAVKKAVNLPSLIRRVCLA
jgi:hypothetical protein